MNDEENLLHVPDLAVYELDSCRSQPDHPRPNESCVRHIAVTVVAAELLRIADGFDADYPAETTAERDAWSAAAAALRARARQLNEEN